MDFVKNIFELPTSTKIFVGISIFLLAVSNAVFFKRFDLIGGGIVVLAHVGLTILLVRMSNYTVLHHLLIFIIPSLLLGFVFFAFSTGSSAKEVMSGSDFVIDFPGESKDKTRYIARISHIRRSRIRQDKVRICPHHKTCF
jgi:hypothetical protein